MSDRCEGYLDWNQARDQYAAPWVSLEPSCSTGEDWLAVIRKGREHGLPRIALLTSRAAIEDLGVRPSPIAAADAPELQAELRRKFDEQDLAYERLHWLRNKTIVLLGDSVDRASRLSLPELV